MYNFIKYGNRIYKYRHLHSSWATNLQRLRKTLCVYIRRLYLWFMRGVLIFTIGRREPVFYSKSYLVFSHRKNQLLFLAVICRDGQNLQMHIFSLFQIYLHYLHNLRCFAWFAFFSCLEAKMHIFYQNSVVCAQMAAKT